MISRSPLDEEETPRGNGASQRKAMQMPDTQIVSDRLARAGDPVTSHEAADTTDVRKSIGLVLDALRSHGPLADHELVGVALFSRFSAQRLRSARKSLVRQGLVVDSGKRTLTPSGRRAIVWEAR